MEINNQVEKCFIITPIGENNSQTRRDTDGLISSVIRPLLKDDFSFIDIKAAHEINASGSINNQIMKCVLFDDLVIANLTGVNPNVMYEVAVRHATLKPIIHICEEGTKLPFDIIDQRTIFYKNDMLGVQELREQLKVMIKEALKNMEFHDNPVYNASQSKIIIESISKNPEKDFEKYLLERIDKMESKLTGKQYVDSDKTTSKYSESFKIQIVTDIETDIDNIYNELKMGLERKNHSLILCKIDKQIETENSFDSWYNIIVSSNFSIPYVDEIEEIFRKMVFTRISKIKIEGNLLPF